MRRTDEENDEENGYENKYEEDGDEEDSAGDHGWSNTDELAGGNLVLNYFLWEELAKIELES
ncbi:hypothetical protein EUX98_g4506 [Antrodiella citrinella]|uniref:Uncharacterized protein n=1 Tax=Antrodiella citrinella TaxID=2447956 RepID=A0A4V3XIL8_9APHY|nr:hypothetical protein EUX98_g4506 [Antrodiella citrinella]